MSTLAPEAITAPASSVTPDHLLDAPLPQLLAELDAELVESSITERGFTGYAWREGGRLLLAMRPGQPLAEREMVARALLGDALGVPMPPLPEPYQITAL